MNFYNSVILQVLILFLTIRFLRGLQSGYVPIFIFTFFSLKINRNNFSKKICTQNLFFGRCIKQVNFCSAAWNSRVHFAWSVELKGNFSSIVRISGGSNFDKQKWFETSKNERKGYFSTRREEESTVVGWVASFWISYSFCKGSSKATEVVGLCIAWIWWVSPFFPLQTRLNQSEFLFSMF